MNSWSLSERGGSIRADMTDMDLGLPRVALPRSRSGVAALVVLVAAAGLLGYGLWPQASPHEVATYAFRV